MKKVYVDLLFTSIPLGKTVDLIINKIYVEKKHEGFCRNQFLKNHKVVQRLYFLRRW